MRHSRITRSWSECRGDSNLSAPPLIKKRHGALRLQNRMQRGDVETLRLAFSETAGRMTYSADAQGEDGISAVFIEERRFAPAFAAREMRLEPEPRDARVSIPKKIIDRPAVAMKMDTIGTIPPRVAR